MFCRSLLGVEASAEESATSGAGAKTSTLIGAGVELGAGAGVSARSGAVVVAVAGAGEGAAKTAGGEVDGGAGEGTAKAAGEGGGAEVGEGAGAGAGAGGTDADAGAGAGEGAVVASTEAVSTLPGTSNFVAFVDFEAAMINGCDASKGIPTEVGIVVWDLLKRDVADHFHSIWRLDDMVAKVRSEKKQINSFSCGISRLYPYKLNQYANWFTVKSAVQELNSFLDRIVGGQQIRNLRFLANDPTLENCMFGMLGIRIKVDNLDAIANCNMRKQYWNKRCGYHMDTANRSGPRGKISHCGLQDAWMLSIFVDGGNGLQKPSSNRSVGRSTHSSSRSSSSRAAAVAAAGQLKVTCGMYILKISHPVQESLTICRIVTKKSG